MTDDTAIPDPEPTPKIDTSVAHSARVWNYWLGGNDHYPADQKAGDEYTKIYPEIVDVARHSRYFLGRAVRYLAGEEGIRQFLDLGTGLPTVDNTHQVAQRVTPKSRIVYVDNDPLVLAHARALLTSTPEGATDYIDADLRDTGVILERAAKTLDFTKPVALILMGILGHIADYDQTRMIVRQLLDAVPSGSYLVINDGTATDHAREAATDVYNEGGPDGSPVPYTLRSPQQIARYFDGLELIEPGVVTTSRWRPEAADPDGAPELSVFCGVARKS